jgi:hypothetical protein
METSMKMSVVSDVAPCSLVDIDHQSDNPDEGGSELLWNVGQYLPDYTVLLHPRR